MNNETSQIRIECFAPRVEQEGPQSIVIEASDGRRCVVDDTLIYMRMIESNATSAAAPAGS